MVIAVCLTGCESKMRQQLQIGNIFAPLPAAMGTMPEGGSQEFESGWRDGCKTGMSTMASNYYKTFYRYTQDPELINNIEYYQAWKDAYHYCRQYVFRWTLWKLDERESFR